jgi:hypothetical protein
MPVVPTPGANSSGTGFTPTVNMPGAPAQSDALFTLDDVDPIGRTEAIIYGPPGSGKSVFAATMPPPLRWIAADGEPSLRSVKWAYKKGLSALRSPKDLVAYAPAEDKKGRYRGPAQALNRTTDMIDYWFSPDQLPLWEGGTLVLDSFTEINEWALNLGLDLNVQYPAPAKPLSKSEETNRKAFARIVTGQQDYKSAMGLIDQMFRNVRLECAKHNRNLAVLCHEWTDQAERDDGTTTVIAVRPLLIGQLRERMAKDVGDVWHMETYNKGTAIEVKVRVHGDNKVLAKTRWGDCLTREVDADYRKMIATVRTYHGL